MVINKVKGPREKVINKVKGPREIFINKVKGPREKVINKVKGPREIFINNVNGPRERVVNKVNGPREMGTHTKRMGQEQWIYAKVNENRVRIPPFRSNINDQVIIIFSYND